MEPFEGSKTDNFLNHISIMTHTMIVCKLWRNVMFFFCQNSVLDVEFVLPYMYFDGSSSNLIYFMLYKFWMVHSRNLDVLENRLPLDDSTLSELISGWSWKRHTIEVPAIPVELNHVLVQVQLNLTYFDTHRKNHKCCHLFWTVVFNAYNKHQKV